MMSHQPLYSAVYFHVYGCVLLCVHVRAAASVYLQHSSLSAAFCCAFSHLLQGMLPMSRLVVGDMAQPTDQVKASGNLEVVLGLTFSEVS
jgi:hypothetical protein